MSISEKIRIERLKKRWTQDDLAKKTGLSTATIVRMEKEGVGSQQNSITKVMDKLGMFG